MGIAKIMKTGLLLSGGIDSTALAYWYKPDFAFTVNYGQVSAYGEIRASKKIAEELNIKHEIIDVSSCRSLGSGDLAGSTKLQISPVSEWWPFRNQFLVTIVAMKAVSFGLERLLVGSVSTDKTHIDGTVRFYQLLDRLLSIQEGKIRLETPAINMTSVELVRLSKIDPSLLFWTHSCHKNDYACGNCRGCYKHKSVFLELEYVAD